ncbi:MAG: hypothetical protein ACFE0S_17685 [Rhodospirillales bacterium]
MHIISILVTATGGVFLVLAGLLAHEAFAGGDAAAPAYTLRKALGRAASMALLDFDRDAVFSVAVPVIQFMLLPGAALLNTVLGGSPFLLTCYVLIAASAFVHILLAERPAFAGPLAVLSGGSALLALVVLPYYAVWSLTVHIVAGPLAEGALIGTLVAVILYAANTGVWMLFHTGRDRHDSTGVHRVFVAALAGMPLGYALYWYVLFGFGLAGSDTGDFRGWGMLIGFTLGFAAVAALFKAVLDAGGRAGRGKFTPAVAGAGLGTLAILTGYVIHSLV